jgi:hypothetical protein
VIEQDLVLNVAAPVGVNQDLNEVPVGEDPQEILLHPIQGQEQIEVQKILPQVVILEEVADNLNP